MKISKCREFTFLCESFLPQKLRLRNFFLTKIKSGGNDERDNPDQNNGFDDKTMMMTRDGRRPDP